MAGVKGIDVNDGRGDVDWARVAGAGYQFAFVKASEGLDYHDKMFGPARWAAMRKAGIIRGAYHYARPQKGRSGHDEARFFVDVVKEAGGRQPGDLPLCLDIEWPDCTLSAQEIHGWCGDFCATVRKATGRDCLTYTGNFWRDRVGSLGPPRQGAALWLPVYGRNDGKTRTDPKGFVPQGGFKLKLHQWTDKGRVDGVAHQPVDCNVWLGTLEELRAFCDGGEVPRPRRRPRPQQVDPDHPAPDPGKPSGGDGAHTPMSTEDIQRALKKIGWPIAVDGDWGTHTTEALSDFQRGYAATPLKVSGKSGPKTCRALRECVANDGRCSEHFTFKEFASKGNGWIKVDRALIEALERYRKAVGGPVTVISAYRDPVHNRRVGGKPLSQHLQGNAADIDAVLPTAKVQGLGVFSGIGFQKQTGLVRHIDVRHRGPSNPTSSTCASPAQWVYE